MTMREQGERTFAVLSCYKPFAHNIHELFYCNRRYAAPTSLAASFARPACQARPSWPQHTVSSMLRPLRTPRASLAWRLGGFVTNRHE